MKKRVFIIHGHNGSPDEGWLPWLRSESVARGYSVAVPPMPDPAYPVMSMWINHLAEMVVHCDEDTYFVGHSLGCQAILRYLQMQLPTVRVGGAVFVAGFEKLGGSFHRYPEAVMALTPWLQEPIHWEMIRGRSRNFVALFSDNDDWVTLENAKIFSHKLEAKTVVLHDRKHFSGEDGTYELPEALDALLAMTGD